MGLLRAFIAVELPDSTQAAVKSQIARLRHSIGDDLVRWLPVESIHITLKFLGDIDTTLVDFLKKMLVNELTAQSEFDLQIGGLGSFPNSKRPRVIWLGIHAPASLSSIQRIIESGTARLGFIMEENRSFSPHLTIGRVKQNLSAEQLRKLGLVLETIQLGNIAKARVDSVHLIKSDLKPAGAVYTKLYSQKLTPLPHQAANTPKEVKN